MEQQAVEAVFEGHCAEITTLESGVELEVVGGRDQRTGFIDLQDEVVFAELFEFIDGVDVHGVVRIAV